MLAKIDPRPKVSSMSELEGERPEEDLGTAIRGTFGEVLDENQRIIDLTAARNAKLDAIRQRIKGEGAPEEERFVARALLSASITKKGPETILDGIEYWQRLDSEIRSHAGETIAWLEPEEVTVSHRFPGPNETDFEYYLNLGILPSDARLQDYGNSGFKIPVEKAVRVRFFYNLDEELTWDMGIGSTWHFVGDPRFLPDPEIVPSPTRNGLLPLRGLKFPSSVSAPLPVIGNEAVANILDANNLADEPPVQRAAQLLTKSLA